MRNNPIAGAPSSCKISEAKAVNSTASFNWEMTELLKHINVGFFSRDILAGKYISLTEGCANIYGYPLQSFTENAMLWLEVVHPDDKLLVEKQDIVLTQGNKSECEYRIIHGDGSIRWIEVKAIPVLKEGQLVRVDGIVSDISDRKKAEEQVIKARSLVDIVMRTLPGIFYLYNSEGKFKYWNSNIEEVTGYTAKEIELLHPSELFEGEERELLLEKIASVFEKGQDDMEAFLITKEKRRIPYYFTGRRVLVDGEMCLVGLGIDLTEKKMIEEVSQKNEEMLSHILNSIPQSIFWKDKNSVFLGCNAVFAKNAGLSNTASVVGKTDFDFPWSAEDSQKYQKDDREIMASKQARIHYVETLSRPGEETQWVDTTKIPLKNKNNEVYGVLGIFDDITERKQEEERQKQLTADLIQKNIELRQFSYIISHNLRAPVSKLLGLGSLLDTSEHTDSVTKELLGYINDEVHGLDIIVKDLNTILSLQDSGHKVYETLKFEEKLKRVMGFLEPQISETKAEITYNFSQAPEIRTIRSYLHSILSNLLSNAIKYRSRDRSTRIHLMTKLVDGKICLSIKDNGLGIDLDKFGHKLFGLYNRFHAESAGGKGIGLNLVKAQVDALGGRIEVESMVGVGTTFKLYFPV
ncbi:PAS domain S-box protein [Pedobacter sp. SYSU D00535]|uniref:PAS domain S-box protein n=1 Tax=Pedobacter sp. SYSU D00535 TaxID=2810308 RepID=UPI001A96DB49|nr:PAS domain S-box protein [Pedobacter sp. SYSU D00535]